VYLKAAKQLGMNPKDCYVIEDSKDGMEAGKAAGCKVIGLVPGANQTYWADYLVSSLKEVELENK